MCTLSTVHSIPKNSEAEIKTRNTTFTSMIMEGLLLASQSSELYESRFNPLRRSERFLVKLQKLHILLTDRGARVRVRKPTFFLAFASIDLCDPALQDEDTKRRARH